jgi:hypothetical protein
MTPVRLGRLAISSLCAALSRDILRLTVGSHIPLLSGTAGTSLVTFSAGQRALTMCINYPIELGYQQELSTSAQRDLPLTDCAASLCFH